MRRGRREDAHVVVHLDNKSAKTNLAGLAIGQEGRYAVRGLIQTDNDLRRRNEF
jgi:hypothetical protein